MAIKTMHRILNMSTGSITLAEWVYDGCVSLEDIEIEYDDQLKAEQAEMVADAIERRINKMNADIAVLHVQQKSFLAIAYKPDVDTSEPIDGSNVALEEGLLCPNCQEGTMEFEQVENCSCHISAPCGPCMDVELFCNSCGWKHGD